jgi:hypothetical protein
MSHFTVLVIGDDVEGQLQPYDENLEVTPYKEHLSPRDISAMQKYYETEVLEDLANHMQDWNGGDGEIDEGGLFFWSTYNLRSQWDWYTVGGRWSGSFKLKATAKHGVLGEPGAFDNQPTFDADQAYKEDIDFKLMSEEAKSGLEKKWDSAQEDGQEMCKTMYGIRNDDCKEAWMERQSKFSTFAVVKDGQWHEQGKMGWFGLVSEEKAEGVWVEEFNKLLEDLPGHTLLTVVDCHI